MTRIFRYLIIMAFFSTLLSCVASRKYQAEVVARTAAMDRALNAEQRLSEVEEEHEKTKKVVKDLELQFTQLKEDYALLENRYKKQQELNKDLQDSYDKLLSLNEKLRGDATNKRKELTEELSRKELELQRKTFEIEKKERDLKDAQDRLERERADIKKLQDELAGKDSSINSLQKNKSDLEKSLQEREDKVSSLEEAIAAREKRVNELEAAMAARDAKTRALRQKLKDAMTGFKSSDLSVEEKNGKVYVSLSQNLLFATGSSKLDSKGASAISKLAEVLNKNSDIAVLVEGHTDSDGDAKMNWELSTKRSLSIVNQLIKSNVAPERITAAGRGEHVPVASNSTDDGKAKNRRTDIILSPNLDAIMDLIKG